MTTPSGQMPLLMRQEDLATWDNWLSRRETSTLESLLNGGNTPGHAAYIWGSAGMGKSHIPQACCDFQGSEHDTSRCEILCCTRRSRCWQARSRHVSLRLTMLMRWTVILIGRRRCLAFSTCARSPEAVCS